MKDDERVRLEEEIDSLNDIIKSKDEMIEKLMDDLNGALDILKEIKNMVR